MLAHTGEPWWMCAVRFPWQLILSDRSYPQQGHQGPSQHPDKPRTKLAGPQQHRRKDCVFCEKGSCFAMAAHGQKYGSRSTSRTCAHQKQSPAARSRRLHCVGVLHFARRDDTREGRSVALRLLRCSPSLPRRSSRIVIGLLCTPGRQIGTSRLRMRTSGLRLVTG